jgi:raffinose/stachyose/melibiose transport system permease protein
MAAIRFRLLPKNQERAVKGQQRPGLNNTLLILAFTIPGMFVFILFLLGPVSTSLNLSLYNWNGLGPMTKYVGLGNYNTLLTNQIFQESIGHSFLLMFLSLIVQLPLALGLALLVGRGDLKGRRLFRGILFIPFVFSEVISAIIWLYVLKPGNGLANMALLAVVPNFTPVAWLGDTNLVLYGIFAVITWKYFGFHMILYMAGLQNISKDLEDAARVDGASERNVLRFITLPLLGSTIRLTVFLSVLGSFQQFVIIQIMTLGGPVNASEVIGTYLYKFGISRFQLGYGSAVAVILFCITLVFSLGYQRIILRRDYSADSL